MLSDAEFDALVQSVSVIGFMFGFMRPAVLRQERKTSTRTASILAKLLIRSLSSGHVDASIEAGSGSLCSPKLPPLQYLL